MDYLKQNHLSILVIVFLAVQAVFGGHSLGVAANVTTITNPWVFQKSVTQTTTNTATSTLSVGCVQMTATSTATPVKLVITNISTTTTAFSSITSGLAVIAAFGNCP